jgi:hypothetical protein
MGRAGPSSRAPHHPLGRRPAVQLARAATPAYLTLVLMIGPRSSARRARHWERVYRNSDGTRFSWFEPEPRCSLEILDALDVRPDEPVIDIGTGVVPPDRRTAEPGVRRPDRTRHLGRGSEPHPRKGGSRRQTCRLDDRRPAPLGCPAAAMPPGTIVGCSTSSPGRPSDGATSNSSMPRWSPAGPSSSERSPRTAHTAVPGCADRSPLMLITRTGDAPRYPASGSATPSDIHC